MSVHHIWEETKLDIEFINLLEQALAETTLYEEEWNILDIGSGEFNIGEVDVCLQTDGWIAVYPCFFGNTLTDLNPLMLEA